MEGLVRKCVLPLWQSCPLAVRREPVLVQVPLLPNAVPMDPHSCAMPGRERLEGEAAANSLLCLQDRVYF